MLTRQELEKNPLFQDITYESYLQMLTCFQAVQRSYRPDEVLYDFTDPRSNSVGILERGDRTAAGPTAPPGGLYLTRLWYEDERLND